MNLLAGAGKLVANSFFGALGANFGPVGSGVHFVLYSRDCHAESNVRKRIVNWWVKGMLDEVPLQSSSNWGSVHPFRQPWIVSILATESSFFHNLVRRSGHRILFGSILKRDLVLQCLCVDFLV